VKNKQRIIPASLITEKVAELCISANVYIDPGIHGLIKNAREKEINGTAAKALDMILDNINIAAEEKMPMCQDTGLVVVFVDIGQEVFVDGNLRDAINEGVRRGYKEGYLRASVIHDPLFNRANTTDNTPAVIHYNIVEGAGLTLHVMPKGFGSENKSAVKMLTPADGLNGVEDFIIETVKNAGPNPCPPIVVGVGVGGTMEKAAILAKEALLYVNNGNKSELEQRLLDKINALGIGAAGLKGNNTALAVHVLTYPTHIAGMPVAVNLGCHVARHKSAEI